MVEGGVEVEVVGGLVVMVPWAAVRSVVTCFRGRRKWEVGEGEKKWEKWVGRKKEVGEGEKKEAGGRWTWDEKKGE